MCQEEEEEGTDREAAQTKGVSGKCKGQFGFINVSYFTKIMFFSQLR